MTSSRTRTRLLGVTAAAAVLLLAGCGSEPASGSGTDIDTSASDAPLTESTAQLDSSDPQATTQPDAPADDDTTAIGSVLVNLPLEVTAADYPGAPVPSAVEVADADELASIYAAVGGIDDVVAAVEAAAPPSGQRLFAYVVTACVVEDISLRLSGDELAMVVKGNDAVRCEPPPLRMVVWTVGAGEVPVNVVPVRAVQS